MTTPDRLPSTRQRANSMSSGPEASTSAVTLRPERAARSVSNQHDHTETRSILSEEDYTSALSHLIRRDFFPALDSDQMDNSEGVLPESVQLENESEELTLSNFHAKFTSEDNTSFQDLLQLDEKRRRETFRWAYEAEQKAKIKARNALYYPPVGLIGDGSTIPTSSEVNHANTRLQSTIADAIDGSESQAGSETPRSSRIDAAIDGRGMTRSWASDIGSEQAERETSGGYAFVSPVPSPKPGDLGEDQRRQLMTWGKVAATPRVVERQSMPLAQNGRDEDKVEAENASSGESSRFAEAAFRIPPTPKRDVLARRLADKGKKRLRQHKAIPSSSTSSLPTAKRTRADLTPAARSLLDRTMRTPLSPYMSTPSGQAYRQKGQHRQRQEEEERLHAARMQHKRWTPSPMPRRTE